MKQYPKIETWVPYNDDHKCRPMVTTQHEHVWEARKARAAELGVHVTEVAGKRV
jgi:hypothetical protein